MIVQDHNTVIRLDVDRAVSALEAFREVAEAHEKGVRYLVVCFNEIAEAMYPSKRGRCNSAKRNGGRCNLRKPCGIHSERVT